MDAAVTTTASTRPLSRRYALGSLIASGGSSTLYRAKDTALANEEVAIKFIHTFLQNDHALMSRLKNEVLIARRLASRHIVEVYDFGFSSEGVPFIVMELVEGCTLRDKISSAGTGAHSPSEVCSILKQLLSALATAHEHQIAHCDVKPENILFDQSDTLKLADFGIARLLETEYNRSHTEETLGTPIYISPEQLLGKKSDARSDIYSVGIITFELLSGQPPFCGNTFFEISAKHIQELPSFEGLATIHDSPVLKDFLVRCLDKNPWNRFLNAREALDYLLPLLDAEVLPSPASEDSEQMVLQTRRTARRKRERSLLFSRINEAVLALLVFLLFLSIIIARGFDRGFFGAASVFMKFEQISGIELPILKRIYGVPLALNRPEDIFTLLSHKNDIRAKFAAAALIERGVNLNIRNKDGDTPLHFAVKNDVQDIVGQLSYRRDVAFDARDRHGHTAFEAALILGHELCARHIIRNERLRPLNTEGDRAIHIAVKYGSYSSVKMLLDRTNAAAVVRLTNKAGNTALHLALDPRYPLLESILDLLVSHRSDTNAKNARGDTPLLLGTRENAFERVEALLRHSGTVDVGIQDAQGKTALELAVQNGNELAVRAIAWRDSLFFSDRSYRERVTETPARRNKEKIASALQDILLSRK